MARSADVSRTAEPNRPRESSDRDPRIFTALGSRIRIRMLDALATDEKGIQDLARELGVHPVTVRYHLTFLQSLGLVEDVRPSGRKAPGRPPVLYRASKHALVPGYPKRHFELLAQVALEGLAEEVGPARAKALLRTKGTEIGKSLLETAAGQAGVRRWTPRVFERAFLDGLMREYGVYSKVMSRSPRHLEYRSFTCPFLEVAERNTELVCDSLDLGFHEGIDEGLGRVRTERRRCMGHGDPYCEYRMTWGKGGGDRRKRR